MADVRIVAATNRNLKDAVARGEFREDLYFRLSVFPVVIPALRERRGDIPLLVRHYVERFCREMNKAPLGVPDASMERLVGYEWPGNVRELANCLERAVILADGEELGVDHLGLGGCDATEPPSGFDLTGSLSDVGRRAAAAAEKAKIRQVMKASSGDRNRAAELLGRERQDPPPQAAGVRTHRRRRSRVMTHAFWNTTTTNPTGKARRGSPGPDPSPAGVTTMIDRDQLEGWKSTRAGLR